MWERLTINTHGFSYFNSVKVGSLLTNLCRFFFISSSKFSHPVTLMVPIIIFLHKIISLFSFELKKKQRWGIKRGKKKKKLHSLKKCQGRAWFHCFRQKLCTTVTNLIVIQTERRDREMDMKREPTAAVLTLVFATKKDLQRFVNNDPTLTELK